jgi:peptide/nickel transport system substrate-binding protein
MTRLHGLKSLAPAILAAVLMSSTAWAQNILRFAISDEPPHLDTHTTTATLTTLIDMHIQETLYTFNSKLEPVPLLAESETISDDGKTIVITLRQGVKFHNGKTMTAADVVASLKRWGEFGGRGKILFDHIASVDASGDNEVTIKFKEVFGPWKNLIAFINGGPAIFPAEIMAEATGEPLAPEKIIGTGPFKFS